MNRSILLLLPALLVGCADTAVDLGAGPAGEEDAAGTATPATSVSGMANNRSGGAVSGTVSAWRFGANGALEAASEGEAEIGEDGRYTLLLDTLPLDGAATGALIVEATFDDGSDASVIVSGAVLSDVTGDGAGDADGAAAGEVVAAPMTLETTAEAWIYAEIAGSVAAGEASGEEASEEMATAATMVRAFVDAEVAGAWAETDAAGQHAVAVGIGAALTAWGTAGDSYADGEAAAGDFAEAMAALDLSADLSAGVSGEGTSGEGAVEVLGALEGAWEEAGATREDLSFMAAAALNAHLAVMEDVTGDVSGGAEAGWDDTAAEAAAISLAALRAELAAEVVGEAWAALEAAGEVEESAEAEAAEASLFEDLTGAVEADGEGAVDVAAALGAAFDGYAAEVAAGLSLVLDAEQAVQVAEAVTVAAEAQGEMMATTAASSAEEVGAVTAGAVVAFRATVEAEIAGRLVESGEFEAAEAEAVAEILAQLYVCGAAE